MPEYTLLTVISILLVLGLELGWLRTGVLGTVQYWVSMIIVWGFQILVDGWLTKLSAPIVIYRRSAISGLRFPWDIPIEDFGFGWSMVTLAIVLWSRYGRRRQKKQGPADQAEQDRMRRPNRATSAPRDSDMTVGGADLQTQDLSRRRLG